MPKDIIYHKPEKDILLAAMLDWGLGHTTRSIPILKEFEKQGYTLIIAGNKIQVELLKDEFPKAKFEYLDGYNIHYSKTKTWFTFNILSQFPKIIKTIKREKKWVKKFIEVNKVDIILSDNRPGFRNLSIYSIYITHQVNVKTSNPLSTKIASALHHRIIRKFNICWVPDTQKNNLAGFLSKSNGEKNKLKYIGPLTRFHKIEEQKKYDLAFVLSGPEPQRTIFENKILNYFNNCDIKIVIVRGTNTELSQKKRLFNIEIHNTIGSQELNEIINQSKLIISRSGYTTIMDLMQLGVKAILVPTPGQTEQEYLATRLSAKGYFITSTQENFDLKILIKQAEYFIPKRLNIDFETYKQAIAEIVTMLKEQQTI